MLACYYSDFGYTPLRVLDIYYWNFISRDDSPTFSGADAANTWHERSVTSTVPEGVFLVPIILRWWSPARATSFFDCVSIPRTINYFVLGSPTLIKIF